MKICENPLKSMNINENPMKIYENPQTYMTIRGNPMELKIAVDKRLYPLEMQFLGSIP